MKAVFFEVIILSMMSFGVFGTVSEGIMYIKGKDKSGFRRTIYRIALVFNFFCLTFITLNEYAAKLLGIETKSLLEYLEIAFGKSDPRASTLPADVSSALSLTPVEVCGRALHFSRLSWATASEAIPFVRQAQGTGEDIDSCRIKLGLTSLEQEWRDAEDRRIKGLANMALCQIALATESGTFSTDGPKQAYVAEARRREFSVADCEKHAGRVQSEVAPERQAAAVQMPKPQSNEIDRATGLPIAVISNPSLNYANLRSGPGAEFNVLARLRNGLEVVILGSPLSASGREWCELSIANGTKGFVSADFVSSSCQLSLEQADHLRERRRQEVQDALQVTKGLVDIFGNLKR